MAYKLSDAINDAYSRKWSMINTFTIDISMDHPDLPKMVGGPFKEDINLNIVSHDTPDFTNEPIEVFVANRWVIQNGRDALYRFTITFRDEDQMKLYKKFMAIYNISKETWFDTLAMTITVSKDADWFGETGRKFVTYGGCMVESVSNLSFSNDTENQIAEFTVSFKCTKPSF